MHWTWRTLNETFGSDHCAIDISINNFTYYSNTQPFVPKTIGKQLLNKKIWEIIHSNEYISCEPDKKFDIFSKLFFDKFKTNSNTHINKNKIWWNQNCNKASALQRKALSKFKKNPSQTNLSALNTFKKKYFYILRTEKRNEWQRICEEINCDITSTELWQKIKRFNGNHQVQQPMSSECLEGFVDLLAGPIGPINIISKETNKLLTDNDVPFTLSEMDMDFR